MSVESSASTPDSTSNTTTHSDSILAGYSAAKDVDPKDLAELIHFLPCETPDAWVEMAIQRQDILLIIHSFLALCVVITPLTLMFIYSVKYDL